MMFVVRQLKELARKKQIPLYLCFIHLTKVYDFIDWTLSWTALARFDVSENMISVICQFDDGMRACLRLDDRVYSEGFIVEQSLRRAYVPVSILFNILFAAAINVAYTRFKADKDIMDVLVHLRKNKVAGRAGESNRRRASPDDNALGRTLC